MYTLYNKKRGHTDAAWVLTKLTDRQFLSGSLDGTVKLWEASSNECVRTYEVNLNKKIYALATFPERNFVTAGTEKIIKIWNLDTGYCIKSLYGHKGTISSLAVVPGAGENCLISQSMDKTVCLWQPDNNKRLLHVIPHTSNYISTVAVVPNHQFITENDEAHIGLWDIPTAKSVRTFSGHSTQRMRAFASLPESDTFASGSNGFDIKLWDIRRADNDSLANLTEHTNYVNALAWVSPNELASASGDKSIKIWDSRNLKKSIFTIQKAHDSWIQGLITIGRDLVSGSGDNSVAYWRSESNCPSTETQLSTTDIFPLGASCSSAFPLSESSATVAPPLISSPNRSSTASSSSSEAANSEGTLRTDSYYFTFHAEEDTLVCLIERSLESKIPPLGLPVQSTILNTLAVLNIIEQTKAVFSTDFNRYIKIIFQDIAQEKNIILILDFVKRLKELGFKERHENSASLWFYSTNGGNQILEHTHYPTELQKFLKEERELFSQALGSRSYHKLIEVGCGELENLSIAQQHQLNYLGIDFSPDRILAAQYKINSSSLVNTQVICLNVLDIKRRRLSLKNDETVVAIFPFNVFGNVAPIIRILLRLRVSQIDFILSIYKNDEETLKMRMDYYRSCGYKNISIKKDQTGITFFSDEGLYTVAYHVDYLRKLISTIGFSCNVRESQYGIVLHATTKPSPTISLTDTRFFSNPLRQDRHRRHSSSTMRELHSTMSSQTASNIRPSSS